MEYAEASYKKDALDGEMLSDEQYTKRKAEHQAEQKLHQERLAEIVDGSIGATLIGVNLRCFCRARHTHVYTSTEPFAVVIECTDRDEADQEALDFARDGNAMNQPHQNEHQKQPKHQLVGGKDYPPLTPALGTG